MSCLRPASANLTAVYITEMVDCETLPENPVFTRVRATSNVPTLARELLTSAELTGRPDISDGRLQNRSVSYEVALELSYGSYDSLLAGALNSSWVSGATDTGLTVDVVAATKTVTITGVDKTSDIKAGDEVYFAGLTGDNATPLMVQSISFTTDTVMVVSVPDDYLTDETGVTTDLKVSDSLSSGSSIKHFAILAVYGDFPGGPLYELTTGAEATGFALNTAVNAFVTGTISMIGSNLTPSFSLPTGATLQEANKNKIYTGIDTCLNTTDGKVAKTTSIDFTLDSGASPSYVICSDEMSHVSYDKFSVTGTIGRLFVDTYFDDKFLNEEYAYITSRSSIKGEGKVMTFSAPHALITSSEKTVDTGDVTISNGFQGFDDGETSIILRRLDTTV
ncbi:major tail protein [Vibrio phage 1.236.O._10N.261.52.C4]|nr:major tail protein [Vibrio phage 1.236.O._10N.261.52.C4]